MTADGHIVNDISTDTMSRQGETQTVDEFEATEAMVRYQCFPHRFSMYGDIEIVSGGN